jgi:DNA-binding Lrp family transcriptional regulator
MTIKDEVIEYLRSKPEGVYQKDLWRDLGIDSRSCSRVLLDLERKGVIEREKVVVDGTVTYKIKLISENGDESVILILSESLPPCIGCREECEPEWCELLEIWIRDVFDKKK